MVVRQSWPVTAEKTRQYQQWYGEASEEAVTGVITRAEVTSRYGGGKTQPSGGKTQPPGAMPDTPPASAGPATADDELLPSGTRVGRYLVIGHIGSGGLGDVYAAFDSELDRKVAIKILRPTAHDKSLGDPTQRLLREAQALAKLRHENVVTVFDVGTFRREVFVAMEFVEGRTLTAWLRTRDPKWREVRDVYLEAGKGLSAAHAAGLVHRDFKLDNVIVSDDGRVTVLDFGLARAIGRLETGDVGTVPVPLSGIDMNTPVSSLLDRDVTRASLVLGTPPYMSPELLTGEPATASTDQFAFCVALFKGLHRRLPFTASTLAEHYDAVTNRRITTAPTDNAIPGWLRKVVERGLEPDPRKRFPSMEALLDALIADRRSRRRRRILAIAAVPLLSIGVATAAIAIRPEPTQTERALTLQLAEEARAAAANGYYVFPPADSPDTPTAYAKVVELESLDGAAARAGKEHAEGLRTELSEALARLGDRYFDRPGGPAFAADFYAAALVFDPEHQRARERVALTPGQLADLARRAEEGEFTTGELKAAEALAVLAIEDEDARAERVREYFGERDATSATQPALLEEVLDDEEKAVAQAAKRQRSKKKKRGLGVAPLEDVAVPLAPTAQPGGPQAIDDLESLAAEDAPTEEAVEAPVPEPLPETPAPVTAEPKAEDLDTPARRAKAKAEAKQGKAALEAGQLKKAELHFNRALSNNRRNVTALAGMARVHFENGDYDQALVYAKRAVNASPRSARQYVMLGDCYVKQLRYDSARTAYRKGIDLGSKTAQTRLARLDAKLGN